MDAATRRFVRDRAGNRCEYCGLRQEHCGIPHHVEHIVARQHGGGDEAENLALACHRCNLHKGPNLSGIDPQLGDVVMLFNPRRGQWSDHFAIRGVRVLGLSATGRATVEVLALNDARRVELREQLQRPHEPA